MLPRLRFGLAGQSVAKNFPSARASGPRLPMITSESAPGPEGFGPPHAPSGVFSLISLRENITLVLQEPLLFRMTVAENIAFGRPGASHDEIVESARAAHAHEFISRLPQGYETMIMDKGCSLSGGERQRIAIARALVKDAPILILDEPSSALDARTESMIFASLTELMRDRTTFIISHRLSTIRNADQILALKDGRLVEQGTHESLLKNDNIYADLYRHQHSLTL